MRKGSKATWTPDIMGERQVYCLIANEGHVWMHVFDKLPPKVRQRLSQSRHNICAACMDIEAHNVTSSRKPSIPTYFAVIEAIERKLDEKSVDDKRVE